MRRVAVAGGISAPALGQGGWYIGDSPQKADAERDALRRGIELGMNLIDTAEMYGDGRSESLIGGAVAGIRRDSFILVSKVYPHNAGRKNIFASCDASLRRLRADCIDIYLLHWRGSVPLAETAACMEELAKAGKIRAWGVSNFDVADMEELWSVPGGQNCAVNQVLYHLGSRGIEYDLLPWLRAHGVAAMAYCPLAQGGSLRRMGKDFGASEALRRISKKYGASTMQILLAFALKQDGLIAIPKSGSRAHVEENALAPRLALSISKEDWDAVDAEFWPPTSKMHLDIE
ncbi:MAG: aldo/keto reductase [Clostridiales bacterium]|nr:aldo/keto reductase [Clostridiales bacterium]